MEALPAAILVALRERRLSPDAPVSHVRRHPDIDVPASMSAGDLEALVAEKVLSRSRLMASHIVIHDSEIDKMWATEREDYDLLKDRHSYNNAVRRATDEALAAFAERNEIDASNVEIVDEDGRFGIYQIADWTPSTRYLKHTVQRAHRLGSVVIKDS